MCQGHPQQGRPCVTLVPTPIPLVWDVLPETSKRVIFMMRFLICSLVILLANAHATAAEPPAAAFDIVIRNARIVDGTGAPWYRGDVGIRNGKIAKIGRLAKAKTGRTIDAQGLVLAPGFVDMMGQTATPFLTDPATAMNLLTQGITTINAGEGRSAAPLSKADGKKAGWRTMAEYVAKLDAAGLPINVAQSVGHTQVRRIVIGEVDRRPTKEELARMQALVEEAMQAGATGVSTALIYPPAVYATTEEIAALAKVAGKYGGRYYTHMRNEGDRLLEAIDEALEIGRTAGVPVHIFHLKAAGRQNWGKMQLAIARIRAARAKGEQVTADIYPYINNGLGIAAFIHPRHFGRGREALLRQLDDAALRKTIRAEMEGEAPWENWYRHVGKDWHKVTLGSMTAAPFSKYNGRSLGEVASELKRDEWDVFFDIAKTGAFALPQSMSEANKIRAMQADFVTFCTDVGPDGGSRISSHPRAYGSFPRILSRYVRDLGVLTLEEAIAKMSSRATNELMTHNRGRIAIGQAADCVLFDPNKITDRATLAKPNTRSTGMDYVLVNGQVVLEKGRYTGAKPGRVLRGPGWRR